MSSRVLDRIPMSPITLINKTVYVVDGYVLRSWHSDQHLEHTTLL
jgi:hypothetical protein